MPSPPKAGWCRGNGIWHVVTGKIGRFAVALKDVGPGGTRGANLQLVGKLNGEPSAIMAIYAIAGLQRAGRPEARCSTSWRAQAEFPRDLDFVVPWTPPARFRRDENILHTLVIALVLVIIVGLCFFAGWRAALIPLLAVPVSLIAPSRFSDVRLHAEHAVLFGLCMAIGLVVE